MLGSVGKPDLQTVSREKLAAQSRDLGLFRQSLAVTFLISVVACMQAAPPQAGRDLFRGSLTGFGPIAFSPGGKRLATAATDGTIDIWDWEKRRRLLNLSPPTLRLRLRPRVTAVAFHRDGRRFTSVERSRINEEDGGERPEECSVRTWDLEKQVCENQVTFDADVTEFLTLSPDGRLLARSKGHQVRLIDTTTGVLRSEFDLRVGGRPEEPFGVMLWAHFSPDSSLLIVTGGHQVGQGLDGDLSAQIWDIGKHAKIADFVVRFGAYDHALALSPDGHYLAVGCFGTPIDVYELPQGKLHATLTRDRLVSTSFVFTPDSRHLVTGASRDNIRIWKLPGGELVSRIDAGDTDLLSLSPDGRILANAASENAIADDEGVDLWDISSLTR